MDKGGVCNFWNLRGAKWNCQKPQGRFLKLSLSYILPFFDCISFWTVCTNGATSDKGQNITQWVIELCEGNCGREKEEEITINNNYYSHLESWKTYMHIHLNQSTYENDHK